MVKEETVKSFFCFGAVRSLIVQAYVCLRAIITDQSNSVQPSVYHRYCQA
jgi:hypothetical protein